MLHAPWLCEITVGRPGQDFRLFIRQGIPGLGRYALPSPRGIMTGVDGIRIMMTEHELGAALQTQREPYVAFSRVHNSPATPSDSLL
jgi:hypothetical protein